GADVPGAPGSGGPPRSPAAARAGRNCPRTAGLIPPARAMATPNSTKKTFRISLPLVAVVIFLLVLRRIPAAVRLIRILLVLTPAMGASIAILCIFSIYWSAAAKNSKPAESSESAGSRRLHLFVLNGGGLLPILSI